MTDLNNPIPPTGPDIFYDQLPRQDLSTYVNEVPPNSDGGMIEAVKRAVIVALRESLANSSLSIPTQNSQIHVDLEYPMKEEQYPGIWVQFSVTKIQRVGISHEIWQLIDDNWVAKQEWMFDGKVTLTIMALTNKERDRISDSLVSMLSFSRPPDLVITKPTDTKKYKGFIASLDQSPYVSITVNSDVLVPGGQTVNIGVPWQEDIPAYVDSWSFDLIGQYMYVFDHDGTYKLSRIDEYPQSIDEETINDLTSGLSRFNPQFGGRSWFPGGGL